MKQKHYGKRHLRLLAGLLLGVLLLSAGCGSQTGGAAPGTGSGSADTQKGAGAEDKVIIAVAVNQWDAVNLQLKDYFDNYIAKELNVEFIYSDATGDVESILKFAQNAWAAGAVGFMDIATQSLADLEPVAAKCNELQMYFTTYYSGSEEILAKYDMAAGCVCSEYETLDALFAGEVAAVIDDGEAHSMALLPLAAQYGNVQQTKSSTGAVQAFCRVYDFEMSEDDIISRVTKDKNNYIKEDVTGREDVKIAIDSKTDAETLSNILKTEDYDLVVISGNLYTRFQQPILEAEQAINKNIRVVTMTGLEDATRASFETPDPFGNPSLDVALLTPATRSGATLAVLLNAIYGDRDAVLVDGKATTFPYPLWACHSAEEYEAMGKADTGEAYYIFTADDVRSMIKKYNDEVDAQFLKDRINEYGSIESVRERRGF